MTPETMGLAGLQGGFGNMFMQQYAKANPPRQRPVQLGGNARPHEVRAASAPDHTSCMHGHTRRSNVHPVRYMCRVMPAGTGCRERLHTAACGAVHVAVLSRAHTTPQWRSPGFGMDPLLGFSASLQPATDWGMGLAGGHRGYPHPLEQPIAALGDRDVLDHASLQSASRRRGGAGPTPLGNGVRLFNGGSYLRDGDQVRARASALLQESGVLPDCSALTPRVPR
jgi:hypothetical protein